MSSRNHVIIGNGILGRCVAAQLTADGKAPLVLSRSGRQHGTHRTVACDVRDGAALARHLSEPTVLYVCAAPPYARWQQEFPPLIDGIEQACSDRDVHIVHADNLYAYGPCNGAFEETQPYRPNSKKGTIRRIAAERLMALNGRGRLLTTIVRAADFFGPGVEQSSVGRNVVESALKGKPVYLLGSPDVPHPVTFVPDFAAALVRLGQSPAAFGHCWHTPSHNLPSQRSLVDAIARYAQRPARVRTVARPMMHVIGIFNPAMRELIEMLYLFEQPCAIDSSRTERTFALVATPLEAAISRTVAATTPAAAALA